MTDKIFTFAKELKNAIDNAEYTDDSPVQYSGDVFVQIAISDWDNVKALDKTNITTKAAACNFLPET